ncbi:MAG TPA: efflux RND transporter periplasmic adaptor subunit [Planctomycetota bacterium]|nr:efflux RND transporter periplasmic adaptor subunit [Planctomycetota bacterium]
MNRRRLPALAAAVVLTAGSLAFLFGASKPDSPGPGRFYAVRTRPLAVKLVELGEVESREVRSVTSMIAGEVTWVAEEGALVKAGEPVLKMNTESLETSLEEDRKANVGLEGELAAQKAMVTIIEKHRAAGVRRSALDLAAARNNLTEAKSHPTPEEKRLADLTLAAARLRSERAARDAESLKDLAGKGFVSDARAKAARLDLVRAQADLVRAEAAHRETLAGAAPQRLRALEVTVRKLQMALTQAEFAAVADVAAAKESLAVVTTRWQVQNDRLKETEKQIAGATVCAPVAGAVALVDVFKGGSNLSPVQVGESHPGGRELLKIADSGAPRVRVRVSEADIARIRPGQPAEVRLRSAPGLVLKARVSSIAVFAEDKNRKLGSLAMEKSGEAGVNAVDAFLDIAIPEGIPQPRLGSTAEVTITVLERPAALTVPLVAVRWERPAGGGPAGPVVRVRRGSGAEAVAVKLGATTEDEAEILEGLAEGDEVLLGENSQ